MSLKRKTGTLACVQGKGNRETNVERETEKGGQRKTETERLTVETE